MKRNKTKTYDLHFDMLPNEIQEGILKNGFTLHSNVMIVWSKNDDTKEVLDYIDSIPENVRKEILIYSHQNQYVDLVCKEKAPIGLRSNNIRLGGKSYPIEVHPYEIKRP